MGRKDKKKVGKTRQDKYYYLAKEQGYRARASFKLIQLNKKYNFLGSSRVCIDLCAAPGGWLQVCAKYMPVSSIIVGVDLVAIKPIKNVTTLAEDITTQKCRASLKKILKNWKADLVLHDGSPNMGTAWVQDAYTQSELTLAALKLATDFLVPGGTFITKVFRSNDYNSLNWVFTQLFKRVEATKPTASRHTSAEIYVICRGFLAPSVLDPRLLDPRHVFKEIDVVTSEKNPLDPKQKRHRGGYEDSILKTGLIFKECTVMQFLTIPDPLPLLASHNRIVWDPETEASLKEDAKTTEEVTHSMQDLKLCGKREFKLLLKWREYCRKKLKLTDKQKQALQAEEKEEAKPMTEEEQEAALDLQLEDELSSLDRLDRRKKKKVREKMAKERERLRLQMVHKEDDPLTDTGSDGLFSLNQMPDDIVEGEMPDDIDYDISINDDIHLGDDDDIKERALSKKVVKPDLPDEADDPIVKRQAQLWFQQKIFDRLDDDDDFGPPTSKVSFKFDPEAYIASDDEISQSEDEDDNYGIDDVDDSGNPRKLTRRDYEKQEEDDDEEELTEEEIMKKKALKILEKQTEKSQKQVDAQGFEVVPQNWAVQEADYDDDDDEDDDEEDVDENEEVVSEEVEGSGFDQELEGMQGEEDGDGDDKETKKKKKKKAKDEKVEIERKAKALAIGTLLLRKKSKNELIDSMYNRFTFNDKQLPKWFTEDEEKHYRASLPVSNTKVDEMKERFQAINIRPIKKVVEAKARKKKRMMEKLDKVKSQAANIATNSDISEKDRMRAIEKLYKGTMKQKMKQGSVYVVSKKFKTGAGGKGNLKIVDKRLKKDKRALLRIQKQQGKKGRKGASSRSVKTKPNKNKKQ